jgi:hypothetical protein
MNPLLFLALAAVLAVSGVAILWLRTRKPSSFGSSISAFQREMQALSPESRSRREHERRQSGER